MPKLPKKRIDLLLVEQSFANSRAKAQAMVMAGIVMVGDIKVSKSGEMFPENSSIRILGDQNPYVSRGGLKLEKALSEFQVDPTDCICLDIGASTGGFTDCLLQKGAKKVYAVDVGYGQLDLKVRDNPNVVVLEKTNARNLTQEQLEKADPTKTFEPVDLIVIDVSFISILKILPACLPLLKDGGKIVSLIKPQFEADKGEVGKGGIVRDKDAHKGILQKIVSGVRAIGQSPVDITTSPITGPDGNIEFFIYICRDARSLSGVEGCVSTTIIDSLVEEAHTKLLK